MFLNEDKHLFLHVGRGDSIRSCRLALQEAGDENEV